MRLSILALCYVWDFRFLLAFGTAIGCTVVFDDLCAGSYYLDLLTNELFTDVLESRTAFTTETLVLINIKKDFFYRKMAKLIFIGGFLLTGMLPDGNEFFLGRIESVCSASASLKRFS